MEGGGRLVKGQKVRLFLRPYGSKRQSRAQTTPGPSNLGGEGGDAEGGVDLSDLGGEEGAALQLCERRQVWIVGEKAAEFLPGGLRLDVREIALSEFGSAH